MYVEQLYTNCLAEAAYYIESEGQAAVIDPMREPTPYLELAARRGATIKYVLETHFHADFVSGHLDLAAATGATIIYGPRAKPGFTAHIAHQHERLNLGKLTLQVLHTPGHTPESSCYLLLGENGQATAVFTGDTLFVGAVGRPDLAASDDDNLTNELLAGMLYDSLHKEILPLADEVIVYPAHGPGSACGKNIGKERSSTIGLQRKLNYALQPMSKPDFITAVLDGLAAPPSYFFKDAELNRHGYEKLEKILKQNLVPLSPAAVGALQATAQVVDTRDATTFAAGHIPGAINIGLDGQYATWAATLLSFNADLVVVAEQGKQEEAVLRLARVGLTRVAGFLQGGIPAWQAAGYSVAQVGNVQPTKLLSLEPAATVVDVRAATELNQGLVVGAQHIPLTELLARTHELAKQKLTYVYCAGGYRSMIAASLLQQAGFDKVVNVQGGFAKIKEAGVLVA